MKLTGRQREALAWALDHDGRVAGGLHRTTRAALYDKGLIAWTNGVGYTLTEAGRLAAGGAR